MGASFRDYKLGEERLQTGAALEISNLGKNDYKSGQRFQIGAKRFQIGVKGISNPGRDCSSAQNKYLRWLARLSS